MNSKKDFIQNIKENEGIIYKVTRIYSDNTEDQKDLYQEIVYQLWKSFDSFKGNSKVSTWMYRVALNTSITHLKTKNKKENLTEIDITLLNKMEDVDTLMEERISVLYQYIKKLNVIEKGIILLHLEGKSYDEISTITGFSNTNVGTRLNRIKIKLKSQITKI